MTTTVYNSSKQRLETVDVELTNQNTTWFDDATNAQDVHTITDLDGGLLIAQLSYNYPIWFDGVSRADINYSKGRAKNLVEPLKSSNREF
jgi:prophage tail gpP-like protein